MLAVDFYRIHPDQVARLKEWMAEVTTRRNEALETYVQEGGNGVPMKDELFAELLDSVRQGGAILRGKRRPSRAFRFNEPDVRALRESYGLSQAKFAALMGISAGTLRNWEQGRRRPEGSARVLLRVVERNPQAVLEVVTGAPSSPRLERGGRRAPHHRREAAGRSTAGR